MPALYVSAVITDRHLYEGDIDLTAEQRAAMEAAFNADDFNSRQRRACSGALSTRPVEEWTSTICLRRKPRCGTFSKV